MPRAFRDHERKIKKSVTEIEKTVKKRHAESVMKKGCLPTSPKKSQRINSVKIIGREQSGTCSYSGDQKTFKIYISNNNLCTQTCKVYIYINILCRQKKSQLCHSKKEHAE